jgi:ribosomal protein S18 acetylase RimI-like enzyme
MDIIRASTPHVPEVSRLFDLYRQFYECESDIELARNFISRRIKNSESVIFIALEDSIAKGFVQLYPSFCSVDAVSIFILYDLYVDQVCRKAGIGKKLMCRASEHARQAGAARLDLLTATDNFAGQHLYEKLGYIKTNEDFIAYSLAL